MSEAPAGDTPLDALLGTIRRCRICRDMPAGTPLPHEPRPIFQISATARVAICSQAPGNKAHIAGLPFYDPSGVRLRAWMGLGEPEFYDWSKVAIIPMGFCFPGYDRHGGDLPPRRECGATWHDSLFEHLPQLRLFLCIGKYSLTYHLPAHPPRLADGHGGLVARHHRRDGAACGDGAAAPVLAQQRVAEAQPLVRGGGAAGAAPPSRRSARRRRLTRKKRRHRLKYGSL